MDLEKFDELKISDYAESHNQIAMGRSDRELEEALRRTVQAICRTGDLENLTVKRVRKATEQELNLPEEFFKQLSVWKDRSKRIIEEEAVSTE